MPCLHKIAAGGRYCSHACGGPNGGWAHVPRRFTVELQTGARRGGVRVVMLGQSQHRESIPYPRLLRCAMSFHFNIQTRTCCSWVVRSRWPISTHNPSLFDLPLTHTDPVGAAG